MTEAATQPTPEEDSPRLTKEEKLEKLLESAATLMAGQGYNQTSIRDVARETGFSLAGMYYYFDSKEDLLYQIQRGTFSRLLEQQEQQCAAIVDTEERLRSIIATHLAYFQSHESEMKICTYELESLTGDAYQEIEEVRRRYYRLTASVVMELLGIDSPTRAQRDRVRHLTMFLFGSLNWVFMWYQSKKDGSIKKLGEEMTEFVLGGLRARIEGGA